jgi:metallo-beta-lactamase class B
MSLTRGILAAASLWLMGCVTTPELPDTVVVSNGLTIRRLAPGVWMHTTVDEHDKSQANGLFVETRHGVVLVDTGWNDATTRQLMGWTRTRLRKRITHAVITHAHADRAGGIRELLAKGIPVYAQEQTAQLLAKSGVTGKLQTFGEETSLTVARTRLELFFPGAGHSPDNIVVWLPRTRLLFGGCLLRGGEARTLGDLRDAELGFWDSSVTRVEQRFERPALVVPGHGVSGGPELFDRTRRLLNARGENARSP